MNRKSSALLLTLFIFFLGCRGNKTVPESAPGIRPAKMDSVEMPPGSMGMPPAVDSPDMPPPGVDSSDAYPGKIGMPPSPGSSDMPPGGAPPPAIDSVKYPGMIGMPPPKE